MLDKIAASNAHRILAKLIDLGAFANGEVTVSAKDEAHCLQVVVTIAKYEPLQMHPETLRRIEELFVPNAVQKAILKALEGKALRSTQLERIVGDRARLFRRPGGIQELKDHGLIRWHRRLGYYRPDMPPVGVDGPEIGSFSS